MNSTPPLPLAKGASSSHEIMDCHGWKDLVSSYPFSHSSWVLSSVPLASGVTSKLSSETASLVLVTDPVASWIPPCG